MGKLVHSIALKVTLQGTVDFRAAFFEGQIEEPVRGLISLLTHQDVPVLVAINARGLYIIDDLNCVSDGSVLSHLKTYFDCCLKQMVLGLRYEEFSWDCSKPCREDNPDSLPCLFVQFMVVENGARVSKILQVFSRQAPLIDTLITSYVAQVVTKSGDEADNKMCESQSNSDNGEFNANLPITASNTFARAFADNHNPPGGGAAPLYNANYAALSTKLSKLTLATFDEEGHCIGQMGSWSFSY